MIARQRLGKNTSIVARKRLGKNVTATMNTQAAIERSSDAPFSMRSISYQGMLVIISIQNFLFLFRTQEGFQTNFAHAVDARHKAGVEDSDTARVIVTLAFV
jgi:hypothetical protein